MCVESDALDPTLIKSRWLYWDGEEWRDAPDNFQVVAMDINFDVSDPPTPNPQPATLDCSLRAQL
jgi:hypothetical protein